MAPSCVLERAPPGKTCAEAKLEAFLTRCRRRIWLVGEMRRTLRMVSLWYLGLLLKAEGWRHTLRWAVEPLVSLPPF
ncbi:hypothetical protein IG631_18929 [Alternaria alternata]|nr:hypothetical protein IG631_18929 [Alternaria alternata]